MRRLIHFVLILLVLGALGWTLWRGAALLRARAGDAPAGEAKADDEKPEDFVVKVEKEKWQALGVEKAEPEKTEIRPQRMAFGRVLDPSPLILLDGDLAAAEAALAASSAENQRTQKLFAASETTSRKALETAGAQFMADQIKVDNLHRKSTLEWGPVFSGLEAGARRIFIDALVKGASALVRVDLLPGDALPDPPRQARVLILGREEQPIATDQITSASDTDPKTQAQGFLLRVDAPPFALRPGMALTAWLELAEPPRAGFILPRSALVRHDGRTWVYVQMEEEKFARKPVVLDSPLDGERGWFVRSEGGGISADDLLVVVGGESLLSEELKAQGGGGEPD